MRLLRYPKESGDFLVELMQNVIDIKASIF